MGNTGMKLFLVAAAFCIIACTSGKKYIIETDGRSNRRKAHDSEKSDNVNGIKDREAKSIKYAAGWIDKKEQDGAGWTSKEEAEKEQVSSGDSNEVGDDQASAGDSNEVGDDQVSPGDSNEVGDEQKYSS